MAVCPRFQSEFENITKTPGVDRLIKRLQERNA
jgi:hypothetical protein